MFVETAAHQFESRAVSRLAPLPDGWLAAGTLSPGERLVIRGAQQLLAREILAQGPPS